MPDPAADRSVASSEEKAAPDAAPDASRRIDAARRVLIGEMGSLDDTDAARLQSGDGAFARNRLADLRDEKSWMLVVCVTMTVFAVVLPTAGLYQFFRAVDNLTPLELIGIIAATCAAGILLMIPPALVYGRWRRQHMCYDALRALDDAPAPTNDASRSETSPGDAASDTPPAKETPAKDTPTTDSPADDTAAPVTGDAS